VDSPKELIVNPLLSPPRALVRRGLVLALALLVALSLVVVGGNQRADAESTVQLGVYRGDGSSSVGRIGSYEDWLGRDVDLIEDFVPGDSWANIGGTGSWDPIWFWYDSGLLAGRDLIVSVPMLTSGSSLQQCASGSFDGHFRDRAANLVGYGEQNAIIRLGWEFNGTWYPWSIVDIGAFRSCWRHAVDAMRSVSGQAFRFDWNPTLGVQWPGGQRFGAAEVGQAWPGDGYVDIVGVDVYDQVPQATSDPVARWAQLRDGELGLEWWADFAAAHGKPLSFPEWAVSTGRSDGGGDNAYYIARMREFMATHDVAYHSYFEFDAPDGQHSLQGGTHPASGDAYQDLFSQPIASSHSPGARAAPSDPNGAVRSGAGSGWWTVDGAGTVVAHGDAGWYGDTSGMILNAPVVAVTGTPSGEGYWLSAMDGGVFSFGDAQFWGSAGSIPLNAPVVGIASSASGYGYWLVAADGGVFSFGDAGFWGSLGALSIESPIVRMETTASGNGYRLIAADGNVFNFGDAA
jgi:hypothetical protein